MVGMEPARTIVSVLGGASAVARAAGVHRTRVYGWMRPKTVGGTGGVIPLRHIQTLLAMAKAKGVRLSTDDFLPDLSLGLPSGSLWPLCQGATEVTASASLQLTLPTNASEKSEPSAETSESCTEISELFTETRKETL